jgi:hypothetical protein
MSPSKNGSHDERSEDTSSVALDERHRIRDRSAKESKKEGKKEKVHATIR